MDDRSGIDRKELPMCRWLAYSGDPIPLELLILQPDNSLIDQSLHSRLGATTTNGDGFGVGWYDGTSERPGLYRSVHPAWNDRNLRELVSHVSSPLFFAHIRASTGTAVQETNTHPFRHGRWLFMHNGLVREFPRVRRDLLLAIAPELIPELEGSSDSEVLFHLALTYGLEDDPVLALERMAGHVEDVGAAHGVEHPLQMSVAVTDGVRIVGARYSSEGSSRSLFFSTKTSTLRELYPDDERLSVLSEEARAVVSEPLGDLPGVWNEVPESHVGIVKPGQDELLPFTPRRSADRADVPLGV
jgi:glutamine amidotransferase